MAAPPPAPPPPPGASPDERDAWVRGLARPHPSLMWIYALRALLTGPLLPLLLPVLYFRYHTLRYAFDDEGVSVSHGILFHHESVLSYRKIQDIHVKRGLIERWFGVATVEIQTASGSATAEVQLEGLEDHEAVRDFLYRRMRGLEEAATPAAAAEAAPSGGEGGDGEAEVVELLRGIKDELDLARRALERRS